MRKLVAFPRSTKNGRHLKKANQPRWRVIGVVLGLAHFWCFKSNSNNMCKSLWHFLEAQKMAKIWKKTNQPRWRVIGVALRRQWFITLLVYQVNLKNVLIVKENKLWMQWIFFWLCPWPIWLRRNLKYLFFKQIDLT